MNRTDLARESRDLHRDIDGITEHTEMIGEISISSITVDTMKASVVLDKPMGTYVTIDAEILEQRMQDDFRRVSEILGNELQKMMTEIEPDGQVLIVGLGNRFVTPDALGPKTAEKIYVTRHVQNFPELSALKPFRSVSAIIPGVLGTTGIETIEIISGIVQTVHPSLLICIDALASVRASHISTTIQLNNTGISPGAGIGNFQKKIDRDTLGIPVVAIGVPMVVSTETILAEATNALANKMGEETHAKELISLMQSAVNQSFLDMIVTPKDIDLLLNELSCILADGINHALFGDRCEDIMTLMQ